AEIGPEGVDLLAYLGREPQILGVAEQIAVFPESAGADALAGVVGEPGADRAMQSLGGLDRHPRIFGVLGIDRRCDPHRAEQPGLDQRAARLLDLARVVDLTALPAQAALDIGGIEAVEPADRKRGETQYTPAV